MTFPTVRPRRLRRHPLLRGLVRETTLSPTDFILPLFVRPGRGVRKEIASMPGQFQLSPDRLVDEVGAAAELGVRAFILFGIPMAKDATGSSALDDDGIVQQALRTLRQAFKDSVLLITDECFCEYTDHGHCGPLTDQGGKLDVDNDATLPLLAQQCVSHAQAGADVVAPSGMMDGMVGAIRRGLDEAGFPWIADHELFRQICVGVLRPVPRRRRVAATVRRPFAVIRWTPPTATRRCARWPSTSAKAPTWSWSSRPWRTWTSSAV